MTQEQMARALRRLVRLQRRDLIARRAKPSTLTERERLLLVFASRHKAKA